MRQFRPHSRMHATALGLAFGVLGTLTALVFGSSAAWADGCTPTANGPSGADAAAFTYQCDGTYAGEWTSQYYVYSPATGTESPLYSETYRYDCANNVWQQNEWDYDAVSAAYAESWVPATIAPSQATGCPADTGSSAGSATETTNSNSANSTGGNAGTTTNTGTTVNNTVNSGSQSGGATVSHNGQAGDATSGGSTTQVTVTNTVGTSSSALNNGVVVFTTTVPDQNGNLILDPSVILPAGANLNGQPPAAITSNTDTSISNAITATAASGNATVAGNGDAGDATSGNAETIVNLINMINSAVAAGHSFIGTINIEGDLNGDILIPQSVIDQLLASNAGGSPDPNLTTNTNESIVNNLNTSAQSGNATVAGNAGNYGDAKTGTASTNVTILNLTGSSVVGQNVLLVFVNVLGQWVGMIMNAPAGATSAEFGGGVSSATPSTDGSVANASANLSITNNVDASAVSGDASVTHNQNGGNARSGDAHTAVNILNMEDSELSLANWFGILFINVFGTWNGNFGIYTPPTPTPSSGDQSSQSDGIATTAFAAVHGHSRRFATFVPTGGSTSGSSDDTAILGDTTASPSTLHTQAPVSAHNTHGNYLFAAIGILLAILLLAAGERDKLLHRAK